MGNRGELERVEERLTKDLKITTIPFRQLGKRYGVSRQAIFDFAKRRGIKRPRRSKREHTKNCSICQSIIRIAKKPHSDFISSQTIKEQLRLKGPTLLHHIHILRKKGLISSKFGRLHSKKAELAYQLYFKTILPVGTIGRQVGLVNFHAAIAQHRALGWDVPDRPLFKYDSNDRRMDVARMNRKKKQSVGQDMKNSGREIR
jgi:hypothetical protein